MSHAFRFLFCYALTIVGYGLLQRVASYRTVDANKPGLPHCHYV